MDDLAFVGADAVVRPATAALEPVNPSLRRLEQIGGPAFWQQLQVQRELAVGAAVVTRAGELAAELVIHAVIRSVTDPVSSTGVRRAITSTLQRASDWQISRLAVPPIGIGPGGLELEQAAEILCEALTAHRAAGTPYPRDVRIVVESAEEKELFERLLKRSES